MTTVYLEKDQVPTQLLGNYTGRKFQATATKSVTLSNAYWDGGTRSTYRLIRLSDGQIASIGNTNPPQFGGPVKRETVPVTQGFAVVEHSIFCGKDMGLTFHVNPADIAKLLPEPVELSDAERIVLKCTASYKSSYRKQEISRLGLSDDEREAAIAACVERGFMRANRSISPAGRNAL